ncbi:HPP family protein [Micromonospora sp. NPDC048930]|uniref:HPP family protein n=1 Tax=Micromonospora sp. NPDC048930 TaxID=3364261 RepID=UPI003712211C
MAATTLDPPALDRRPAWPGALAAGALLLAAMALLAGAERTTGRDVFALPFVASAAVLAMAPRAPLARPAAVLRSYPVCAAVAVAVTAVTGPSAWAATASAVLSVVLMLLLRAPHAPAAVGAALIGLTAPGPGYLLDTVLPAVAVVLGAALIGGRLLPAYDYPPTWR